MDGRAGGKRSIGEPVVELCVYLKICESCGCFWYRRQGEPGVYCTECKIRLTEFPTPQSRKRRGRPTKREVAQIWAVTDLQLSDAAFEALAGGAK